MMGEATRRAVEREGEWTEGGQRRGVERRWREQAVVGWGGHLVQVGRGGVREGRGAAGESHGRG